MTGEREASAEFSKRGTFYRRDEPKGVTRTSESAC